MCDSLKEWIQLQEEIGAKIVSSNQFSPIRYIGGLDVAFIEDGSKSIGVGALVVVDAETLKPVYTDTYVSECFVPYISGFLGFREVPFAEKLIERLNKSSPEFIPQIYLVDGCGYYHPRHCGYATHLGVKLNIATIGVSKSFLKMDGLDVNQYEVVSKFKSVKYLEGISGNVLGAAVYSSLGGGCHPIYVSIGNKVDLVTSIEIVCNALIHKIPEPIRLADKLSRTEMNKLKEQTQS